MSARAFEEAKRFIPGGVNSPVRAFRAWAASRSSSIAPTARTSGTSTGMNTSTTSARGARRFSATRRAVVIDAIRQAAQHGVSFGIPNPYEVEMAKLICEWVPSVEKVRMVNSGTEATMSCMRLARGFTGRDKIVKFEGCYHGHVDSLLVKAGSGALTHGQPDSAGVPAALAELTITLPFNDADAVRSVFAREGREIAAVILEPIPANAGLYFPRNRLSGAVEEALRRARRAADFR